MTDDATKFPFKHFEAYLPSHNSTFHNPAFTDAPYRVLIARLSPFQDVTRSIPHLLLYQEVRRALLTVLERTTLLIEPSAAIGEAALLARRIRAQGLRVGVILSGGNVDLRAWVDGLQRQV